MWCYERVKNKFQSLCLMGFHQDHNLVVRYRGFLLLKQHNQTWLVRPERSPMILLPFRTHKCSLATVKEILETKLSQDISQAA